MREVSHRGYFVRHYTPAIGYTLPPASLAQEKTSKPGRLPRTPYSRFIERLLGKHCVTYFLKGVGKGKAVGVDAPPLFLWLRGSGQPEEETPAGKKGEVATETPHRYEETEKNPPGSRYTAIP